MLPKQDQELCKDPLQLHSILAINMSQKIRHTKMKPNQDRTTTPRGDSLILEKSLQLPWAINGLLL